MRIHREGFRTIILTLILIIISNGFLYFIKPNYTFFILFNSISVLGFLMILQFFRNPPRIIPYNENHVMSPADGKIVVVEEVFEDEYYKEKRLQVSIFMSPINVHVNRYPFSGIIRYMKYHPGQFLVAWNPKSSTENERTSIVVENKKGTSILIRQIAGAMAKRIIYYSKEGEKVRQGDELGFIKFGSRVDLFLPIGAILRVKLNQKVKGGESVIAKI